MFLQITFVKNIFLFCILHLISLYSSDFWEYPMFMMNRNTVLQFLTGSVLLIYKIRDKT